MDRDVEVFWALVAGLLMLFGHIGAVMITEGLTRRRRVLTVSARHLGGLVGATIGAIGVSLVEVPVLSNAIDTGRPITAVTTAILMTGLATAALTERATVVGHAVVGLLTGGVLLPAVTAARYGEGLLATISIGGRPFVDTAAATFFLVAGAVGLTGTMVIGPRRGSGGPEGSPRHIPGKSTPVAVLGVLMTILGLIGVLTPLGQVWTDAVADAAVHLLVGAATGALIGGIVSYSWWGWVRSIPVIHGTLAGLVATTGDPFGATVLETFFLAGGGTLVALFVGRYLRKAGIDDPVGSVAIFGAAAVFGSIGVGFSNGSQFFAQLVGVGITGAGVLIVSGLIFALLRVLRVLRVRPDVEVAGLDP